MRVWPTCGLQHRRVAWTEPRIGEHAPSRIVEGRSGIASGFTGEGAAAEVEAAVTTEAAPPLSGAAVAGGACRAEHCVTASALVFSARSCRLLVRVECDARQRL